MANAILGLKLSCFRGASLPVEIEFDRRRPSVLVFGENGTGKSTIVDSIDFVANESIGSLQHRSLDGASRVDFLKTKGAATGDVTVSLTTLLGEWTAGIQGRSVVRTGPDDAPVVRVLRRPGLNNLMEARPQERYAELQRFVGAEEAESAERHLDTLEKAWSDEFDSASRIVQQSIDRLKGLAEEAGRDDPDPLPWALKEQATSLDDVNAELDWVKAAAEAAREARSSAIAADKAVASVDAARQAVTDAETRVAESDQAVDGADALVPLLQQAEDFVKSHATDTCPVCEQTVEPAELQAQLSERLKSVQALVALLRERAQRVTVQRTAESKLADAKDALKASVATFRENALCIADLDEEMTRTLQNDEELLQERQAIQDVAASVIESLQTKERELQGVITRRQRLERHLKEFETNTQGAEKAQRLRDCARRIHRVLQEERVAHSTRILDQIGYEVDRLYEMIHPGEGLGGCRLSLVKRASIEHKALFEGDEVVPGAYYSESHLDTLGFCVWVAIAKLERPEETIVVLDDVFTSVDLEHLGRIADVIDDMVDSFAQVIVVTHSRRWLDHYRYSQGGGSKMDLKQLLTYSPAVGVRLVGTKLPVQQLADRLREEPLDRQSVAGIAGVILEAVLDRLCLQYRRPVPRTADMKWTLGEYLDAIKEKHLKKLGIEHSPPEGETTPVRMSPPDAAKPLLEQTGPMREIRNKVGSHFNLDGAEISDKDVKRFGECVRDLADSLSCPWCGSIPEREDGEGFLCGCKATRLKPLKL